MADKISLEDLLQVVKVLGKDDESKEDPKEDPKHKTEEEIREEILAELKAEQEAEKEKKTKEDPKQDDDDEDEEDEPKSDSREDKHIARTIKAGLKGASLDSGVVESVLEFIDYGTLKNEEGEADDDKLESFVELISGVARRTPPKGKTKRDINDDGGLHRYLQDNK